MATGYDSQKTQKPLTAAEVKKEANAFWRDGISNGRRVSRFR